MLKEVSRVLVFVVLITSTTSQSQNDVTTDTPFSTTTTPDEPVVIRLEEVKIYQRHFRIILEAGMNENCFSVEVEPTQHLNVDYTVSFFGFKLSLMKLKGHYKLNGTVQTSRIHTYSNFG